MTFWKNLSQSNEEPLTEFLQAMARKQSETSDRDSRMQKLEEAIRESGGTTKSLFTASFRAKRLSAMSLSELDTWFVSEDHRYLITLTDGQNRGSGTMKHPTFSIGLPQLAASHHTSSIDLVSENVRHLAQAGFRGFMAILFRQAGSSNEVSDRQPTIKILSVDRFDRWGRKLSSRKPGHDIRRFSGS